MLKLAKQMLIAALLTAFGFDFFGAHLLGVSAQAAEKLDYYLIDGVDYDPAISKPRDILGHDIGAQPIRPDLMVAYLRTVASQSDRMTIQTIGYSHERRPIVSLIVTHPDNHARLDAIKAAHKAALKPGSRDDADLPVITWVNYGVHGAEASGMDAVVPTIYDLAAARGPKIEQALKGSVIIITAVFNPDGHARRASWVTGYGSRVINRDPTHEIHNAIWPGGRTNHYWFDLNRQWMLQTQPESQAWMRHWHDWKPHVTADMHEMGSNSSYYFHPGVPTRKFPLIPDAGRALAYEIADYHTAFFDSEAKLFFSEEGFDNFYVGKGSTYPQVNGGIGILFEAGGQMGIEKDSNQGVKTYANNIRNHFRTSLTTIVGAYRMRTKLRAYSRQFYRDAVAEAEASKTKAYLISAPEDPYRLASFVQLMRRHDITVRRLTGKVAAGDQTFGVGDFAIELAQNQYRFIRAMFDTFTDFPDRVFYDVSGWTMPEAYGLKWAGIGARGIRGKLGEAVTIDTALPAPQSVDEAPYAYMFRWSNYLAPKAVNRLLQKGALVRVGLEPMRVKTTRGEVRLARGAIIVPFENQTLSRAQIHSLMTDISLNDRITVHAVTSGRSLDAGADLGGRNSVRDLSAPKPLMIIGTGVSPYDAGEVWHQLDHRMQIPLTMVRGERLGSVAWSRYTHVILVGGRVPLSGAQLDKMKQWVRRGGTVLASRSAAAWAQEKLLGRGPVKPAGPETGRLTYLQKTQKDAEHVIGGAQFASSLDLSHPMAFGYARPRVVTNKNTSLLLAAPKDPYAQVAVYDDQPLVSGYASDARLKTIRGTPMMTAERMGRGAVILYVDNPNFRATYLGAEKLFLNGLFFSKAFGTARGFDDAGEDMADQALD